MKKLYFIGTTTTRILVYREDQKNFTFIEFKNSWEAIHLIVNDKDFKKRGKKEILALSTRLEFTLKYENIFVMQADAVPFIESTWNE